MSSSCAALPTVLVGALAGAPRVGTTQTLVTASCAQPGPDVWPWHPPPMGFIICPAASGCGRRGD